MRKLAGLLAAAIAWVSIPAAAQADLVIENVSIVDVENGEISTGQTVVIDDGRIVVVGTGDVLAGEGTEVVSGSGHYLIPGLWDAHVHSAYNADWHFPLFLAHGVTSVRNLHTTDADGFEQVQRLRAGTANGDIFGPRFLANGFIVDGGESWPQATIVTDVESARAAVDAHIENGMDFLKVYSQLSPEVYRAILAYAQERDIPADGHLPDSMFDDIDFSLGQRTFEHAIEMTQGCTDWSRAPSDAPEDLPPYMGRLYWAGVWDEFYDAELCRATASAMAEHGAVAVPTFINTLTYSHAAELMAEDGATDLLPEAVGAQWQGMGQSQQAAEMLEEHPDPWVSSRKYLQLWRETGTTVLAGTDVGNPFMTPGDSLLRELEIMVELGMPESEALRTATINPARVFDIEGLGLVEAGYHADLVLLDANPLEDIANIRSVVGVVRRGIYHSREELDANVASALERANANQDD